MNNKCLVGKKYEIQKPIAKGSFGQIYIGENITTHQKFAIKFEPIYNNPPQNEEKIERLKNTSLNYKLFIEQNKNNNNNNNQENQIPQVLLYECRTLRFLNGELGFPTVHWYGIHKYSNSYALVMELLDVSISSLFKKAKSKRFSLKTVLMIADQMISRLEFLHKKGFIHCDVKPENMLLGRGYNSNVIHLIDFGLSKRYLDKDGNHIEYGENSLVCGTARYMSINSHLGINLSRRDDMESLGYILIYLLKGELPWQGLNGKQRKINENSNLNSKADLYTKIAEIKLKTPIHVLCQGIPEEFQIYLQQVRSLRFEDEPDYSFYRHLFRTLFIKSGFTYDMKFDWVA